jgi:hypothetical protein
MKFLCANIFGAIVLKPRFKIDVVIMIIQGGSDISGTLSKLHCHIKKLFFKTILLPQTFLAICRSINKNKKSHSGKDKSTGSYKSRYSLRTSRRTYCEEVMSYGNIKKSTSYDAEKKCEKFIKMNRANMRRLCRRMALG